MRLNDKLLKVTLKMYGNVSQNKTQPIYRVCRHEKGNGKTQKTVIQDYSLISQ